MVNSPPYTRQLITLIQDSSKLIDFLPSSLSLGGNCLFKPSAEKVMQNDVQAQLYYSASRSQAPIFLDLLNCVSLRLAPLCVFQGWSAHPTLERPRGAT